MKEENNRKESFYFIVYTESQKNLSRDLIGNIITKKKPLDWLIDTQRELVNSDSVQKIRILFFKEIEATEERVKEFIQNEW